jgi:hypothetical protein
MTCKQPSVECVTTTGVKNERCFLCGPCEAYITSICYSLDETERLVQSAYKRSECSDSSEFLVEDSHGKFVVEEE